MSYSSFFWTYCRFLILLFHFPCVLIQVSFIQSIRSSILKNFLFAVNLLSECIRFFNFYIWTITKCLSTYTPQLSVVLFSYLNDGDILGWEREQLIVEVCFDKHLVIVQVGNSEKGILNMCFWPLTLVYSIFF